MVPKTQYILLRDAIIEIETRPLAGTQVVAADLTIILALGPPLVELPTHLLMESPLPHLTTDIPVSSLHLNIPLFHPAQVLKASQLLNF